MKSIVCHGARDLRIEERSTQSRAMPKARQQPGLQPSPTTQHSEVLAASPIRCAKARRGAWEFRDAIQMIGIRLMKFSALVWLSSLVTLSIAAHPSPPPQVVDLPTRPGITVRILALIPETPKATVILLSGGDGGVQIFPGGSMGRFPGNFLLRSRQRFVVHGLAVVVVDAPSDRARPPYLRGFRHSAEHSQDLAAVIEWAAKHAAPKVWLVGTSRGTESAAAAGLKLQGMPALAGVVLTSSILVDNETTPVPALQLPELRLPILVVHHERDTCRVTRFSDLTKLTARLPTSVAHRVVTVSGGISEGGDCEGMSYHGFNGREEEVVGDIVRWIDAN